jgi:hypothetical protein
MTVDQISRFISRTASHPQKALYIVESLGKISNPALSAQLAFEARLNLSKPGIIKIIFAHSYRHDISISLRQALLQQKRHEFLSLLWFSWGKEFTSPIVEKMALLKNIDWKIGFEYDASSGHILKITYYCDWQGPNFFYQLAEIAQIKKPATDFQLRSDNCDCLGIDIAPTQGAQLKAYIIGPASPVNIPNTNLRSIFNRISREYEINALIFRHQIHAKNRGMESPKIIFRFRRGVYFRDLRKIKEIEKRYSNMHGFEGLLKGQIIYYLAFAGSEMELYFRKMLSPFAEKSIKRQPQVFGPREYIEHKTSGMRIS